MGETCLNCGEDLAEGFCRNHRCQLGRLAPAKANYALAEVDATWQRQNLLDEFAKAALPTVLAQMGHVSGDAVVAVVAYEMAEAMLDHRLKMLAAEWKAEAEEP